MRPSTRVFRPLVALTLLLAWTATASAQQGSQQGGVVLDGRLPAHGVDGQPPPVRQVRPIRPPPVRPPASEHARLRAMLSQRRATNLARFRAYVAAESYPRNRVGGGLRNVLIDDEDRFCAAANLMRRDGYEQLVRQTARTRNDLRLFDVRSGPFYEWILTSGLTQEEIDEIQEPFAYIPPTDDRLEDRRWELEKRRLKRVYRRVLSQLVRDTERSLDIAAARLAEHRAPPVVIAPPPPVVRPVPPPVVTAPPPVVRPVPPPVVIAAPPVVRPVPPPVVVRPLPDPRRPLVSVWAPR